MTEMDRRIFYSPDFESTNELPEDESAHCLRVLRYGIGDEIEVTDGRGPSTKHAFHPLLASVAMLMSLSVSIG